MNEALFSRIQNVLLDLVCNKSDTMTVDDATAELMAIVESADNGYCHCPITKTEAVLKGSLCPTCLRPVW